MIAYNSVGARDTQIVIQSKSVSYDSLTNEQVEFWSDFATVWGEYLKPIRSNVKEQESRSDEVFEADQQVEKKIVQVRIKYLDGILPTMRFIVDTDEINYITGVDLEGRRSYIVLTAEVRDDNVANDAVDAAGNVTIQDEGVTIWPQ